MKAGAEAEQVRERPAVGDCADGGDGRGAEPVCGSPTVAGSGLSLRAPRKGAIQLEP